MPFLSSPQVSQRSARSVLGPRVLVVTDARLLCALAASFLFCWSLTIPIAFQPHRPPPPVALRRARLSHISSCCYSCTQSIHRVRLLLLRCHCSEIFSDTPLQAGLDAPPGCRHATCHAVWQLSICLSPLRVSEFSYRSGPTPVLSLASSYLGHALAHSRNLARVGRRDGWGVGIWAGPSGGLESDDLG